MDRRDLAEQKRTVQVFDRKKKGFQNPAIAKIVLNPGWWI